MLQLLQVLFFKFIHNKRTCYRCRHRLNFSLIGRFGFPWVPFRLNQKVRGSSQTSSHSLSLHIFKEKFFNFTESMPASENSSIRIKMYFLMIYKILIGKYYYKYYIYVFKKALLLRIFQILKILLPIKILQISK